MTTGESAPPDPDEPLVAGRYELGPVLGVGSSAVVRRGRDLSRRRAGGGQAVPPGRSLHDRRQQHQEMAGAGPARAPRADRAARRGTEAGRPVRGHRPGRGPDAGRADPGRPAAGRRGARARGPAGRRAGRRARGRHRAPGPQAGQRAAGARPPAAAGRLRHLPRGRRAPRRPPQAASSAPPPTWRRSRCAGEPSARPPTSTRSAWCCWRRSPGAASTPGSAVESATAGCTARPPPRDLPADLHGCWSR